MKRKRRNGRADDQGRLVEELAQGVGPQARGKAKALPAPEPSRRRPRRPEPEPEPEPAKRSRRRAPKEAPPPPAAPELPPRRPRKRRPELPATPPVEPAAAIPEPEPPPKRKPGRPRVRPLPDPSAPKRPRGRPPKTAKADPLQMAPEVEPDEVELPPSPTDEAGRPLSELWDAVRGQYKSAAVRGTVERLMRAGSLELDDLVWLELAEHEQLGLMTETAGERLKERLVSARLQSRKQVMRILVERGPVGGVNARNVRVPPGLELEELTRPPDLGDDVLAEPVVEDLPERYREVAMMQRGPT